MLLMAHFMSPVPLNLTSPTFYIKQECPPPDTILDLCVRKRSRVESPDYTLSYPSPKRTPECVDPITTTYYTRSPEPISQCYENSPKNSVMSPNPSAALKTRPFKAFPKDPLALNLGVVPPTSPISDSDSVAYEDFRTKMLAQVQASHNISNKNMRRIQNHTEKSADPEYLERRKKNNEAAKRSRDARKAKEDEIAIRCAFLEQENMKMKFRLAALNGEVERLQSLLYR
ncbi:unnamed protein product [Phaedon cochleariae]|uniref:BZIP domain-containing protein n=1 Tax=Phaedon cochleariae TaxID=80249 RepID=A0A9P0DS72_PHACE|nr:unnamed protein product [Phaedon cochleariae]